MIETGRIINGDCVEVMKTLPEGCIDLVVTSPPYGVGIDYDVHEDDVEFKEYIEFAKAWLSETYRVLKDDGRIALNIPYEINRQKKGGRIFFVSEMWQIMKEIGFGFFGIVDLEEQSPHRSKTTAWETIRKSLWNLCLVSGITLQILNHSPRQRSRWIYQPKRLRYYPTRTI